MYMYNKAYESLVASKWIIFLFKSRNILCVWPLPNSVTMSQWLLSFSVCIFKITILVPSSTNCCGDKWGNTEEQDPWHSNCSAKLSYYSYYHLPQHPCHHFCHTTSKTCTKYSWDPEMDSDLIAGSLPAWNITIYIQEYLECKLLNQQLTLKTNNLGFMVSRIWSCYRRATCYL